MPILGCVLRCLVSNVVYQIAIEALRLRYTQDEVYWAVVDGFKEAVLDFQDEERKQREGH
jgi:hypothetical protein